MFLRTRHHPLHHQMTTKHGRHEGRTMTREEISQVQELTKFTSDYHRCSNANIDNPWSRTSENVSRIIWRLRAFKPLVLQWVFKLNDIGIITQPPHCWLGCPWTCSLRSGDQWSCARSQGIKRSTSHHCQYSWFKYWTSDFDFDYRHKHWISYHPFSLIVLRLLVFKLFKPLTLSIVSVQLSPSHQ